MLRFAATRHTRDFVQSQTQPCRLLEVGCGDGLLALDLTALGFSVQCIDNDPAAVTKASANGVLVSCADILKFEGAEVDAVLFSRSLHHVHDTDGALDRARALLSPRGCILIEDFGVELADKAAANWRYDLRRVLSITMGQTGADFPMDTLALWREEHGDHVLPFQILNSRIQEKLTGATREFCPYLYRYLLEDLKELSQSVELGNMLLQWEKILIARGDLPAIGVRWVWRNSEL